MTEDEECEPEPMREIHKIRLEMYEEFKGLTLEEIVKIVKESAAIERKRIYGVKDKKDS